NSRCPANRSIRSGDQESLSMKRNHREFRYDQACLACTVFRWEKARNATRLAPSSRNIGEIVKPVLNRPAASESQPAAMGPMLCETLTTTVIVPIAGPHCSAGNWPLIA